MVSILLKSSTVEIELDHFQINCKYIYSNFQLTVEEKCKRLKRLQQNKEAARKCREKKKQNAKIQEEVKNAFCCSFDEGTLYNEMTSCSAWRGIGINLISRTI